MLDTFKQHIHTRFPELLDSKSIIAVSGGMDSMVLAYLCNQLQLNVAWAHCNFKLRGVESDGDAAFVQQHAQEVNVPFFIKDFDTSAFAKAHKQSIQMAARTLRYEWFEALCLAEGYDCILTAHHANDQLETFLINLSRGSGIDGLCAIPERSGRLRRVLLPFSRKQIASYASSEQIKWREDASNASDAYLRNHIRHHAVPALEEAVPHFLDTFKKSVGHLDEARVLLDIYSRTLREHYMHPSKQGQEPEGIIIDLVALRKHEAPRPVLYALLKDYHFTAWGDVYELMDAQSGKQVFSATHRLIKDRDRLLLSTIPRDEDSIVYWEEGDKTLPIDGGVLSIDNVMSLEACSKNEILVDRAVLEFPLAVRRYKEGDVFYPFGMKGKKKLSKYFKDEKLSLIAKEQIRVLCSGAHIVWVIGHRADARFAVTKTTNQISKITYTHDAI